MKSNNQVTVSGWIASKFTFSHEVFGEKLFTALLAVERSSGAIDLLPVLFSERIIHTNEDYTNAYIQITGQFRSHNQPGKSKSHLVLHIFVQEYEWIDEGSTNNITLEGYICKPPTYRKTPLGREIADVMLAVNRPYGKSDYIPCVCWGRNARFAESLLVGDYVRFAGRIQSREYMKNEETKTAYEVSVSTLEIA